MLSSRNIDSIPVVERLMLSALAFLFCVVGKTAYGEIIVDTTVSNLNTVVFYNEGEQIGEKYIFPFTLIAPLTADGKVLRANVLRKLSNDIARKIMK